MEKPAEIKVVLFFTDPVRQRPQIDFLNLLLVLFYEAYDAAPGDISAIKVLGASPDAKLCLLEKIIERNHHGLNPILIEEMRNFVHAVKG